MAAVAITTTVVINTWNARVKTLYAAAAAAWQTSQSGYRQQQQQHGKQLNPATNDQSLLLRLAVTVVVSPHIESAGSGDVHRLAALGYGISQLWYEISRYNYI